MTRINLKNCAEPSEKSCSRIFAHCNCFLGRIGDVILIIREGDFGSREPSSYCWEKRDSRRQSTTSFFENINGIVAKQVIEMLAVL